MMICKECKKHIDQIPGSKFAVIALYEKDSRETIINLNDYYNINQGTIYVCYDCWKEISPSQYHIKERNSPYDVNKDASWTITPEDLMW